ncbi:DASS family sodium-coupled anion symporter [uncultured Phascolarctobacterium sp.]|uniref:DASS family sodium-coupled anion symporter n=1 Tax=uncultured Phascolarctobacterium sp. TaxID=512296 RepID=UPI0025DE2053|nr:DASS family sodium-coupled anion symporter [uncultured Phascolarctobacterium sp.]
MKEKEKTLTAAAANEGFFKKYGFYLALLVLCVIVSLPTPDGLSVAGHRMLGIMVFSVIVWATTAISYPVSAGVIIALMALLIGFAPNPATGKIFGTAAGLAMGLKGFSSTAFCLVGAALFLAAAMTKTGLDKRIALTVLSKLGTKSNHVVIGVICCGFILSFFVPSTTARVACLVPIVLGMISAFGVPLNSRFAGMLMITVAQVDSVWNVGIKTAAAQNMVAVNFIRTQLGVDISWMDWFIAAAPFAILMSFALYHVMMFLMPPEIKEIPGGKETVKKLLADMGKITTNEIKLLVISICLLILWTTEKKLHVIDTSTTTMVAITLLMLPKIGVMQWNEVVNKINWGTVVLFGVGISLGSALLSTKAATWLANVIVSTFDLADSTTLTVLAIMALFLIIVHMGFASAAGLASAIIPIIISVLQQLKTPGVNVIGMTMILQYVVSFGFILPVNAPQNMIAYGTNTFEVRDFVRSGIPLTLIGFALIMLLGSTYWKWLGLV